MTKGQRFIQFWGTVLVFYYLKPLKKIPQDEENMRPVQDIYLKICLAAEKHGLIEGRQFIEYWELE